MLALYIVLGIILCLIVIFMLLPVFLTFSFKTVEKPSAKWRVQWLFGLVSRDMRQGEKVSGHAIWRDWKQVSHRIKLIGTDIKTISALMRLLKSIIRSLKVKQLSGCVKMGLDDPAETGMAFGFIQPLLTCLSLPATADFRIEPDFTASVFEIELEGTIRVNPIRVMGIALGFIFSPDGWRAVRWFIRTRKS